MTKPPGEGKYSDPVLTPSLFRFLVTFKAEINTSDVLEPFGEIWGSEATGEITECDAREECAGFGVLFARMIQFYFFLLAFMSKNTKCDGFLHTRSRFAARTASLCRHNSGGEVKYTTRMGILCCRAISVQYALVSGSAFVLSGKLHVVSTPRIYA